MFGVKLSRPKPKRKKKPETPGIWKLHHYMINALRSLIAHQSTWRVLQAMPCETICRPTSVSYHSHLIKRSFCGAMSRDALLVRVSLISLTHLTSGRSAATDFPSLDYIFTNGNKLGAISRAVCHYSYVVPKNDPVASVDCAFGRSDK